MKKTVSHILVLSACLVMMANVATADEAPPQLNIQGFAHCLAEQESGFDFEALSKRYHFNFADLLLPYLAIYPGTHLPGVLTGLQRESESYWQTPWEKQGEVLADTIRTTFPTTPAQALALAMKVCDARDIFCAALSLQNVYKTLGRHDQAIATDPHTGVKTNYNPAWFKDHESEWQVKLPQIQQTMISLRTDGAGDRWGEWYHFFGIVAYATRDIALGKDESAVDFTVRMNQLLNPLIAGEPENPLKARFDRDSAQVAWNYLKGLTDLEAGAPAFQCTQREAFVQKN